MNATHPERWLLDHFRLEIRESLSPFPTLPMQQKKKTSLNTRIIAMHLYTIIFPLFLEMFQLNLN